MILVQWERRYTEALLLIFGIFFILATESLSSSSRDKKEIRLRNKKEGIWSEWSNWSSCSRSCGGGIRTQTRQCKIRRSRSEFKKETKEIIDESKLWKNVSGNNCEGHGTRHHLCNNQACPSGTVGIRESQCKAFDNRPFMGKVYQWEAFLDQRSPCSLTCRAKGFRFFTTLNKSVIDGTPCRTLHSNDLQLCVSGQCTSIGCDGIAGSQRRFDRCGVCGGDNSTCRVVSGIFTRPQLPVGYNLVAHIPRGACNLSISQIRKSPNYLALRKSSDGSYILNGNWGISWAGEYEGAGSRFKYIRQDSNSLESISAPGPLSESIDLLVLSQQPNPGIKYEYMLPGPESPIPPIPQPLLFPPPPKQNSHSAATLRPSSFVPFLNSRSSSQTDVSHWSDHNLKSEDHPHLHSHHHNNRRRGGIGGGIGKNSGDLNRGSDKRFSWKVTGYTNCTEECGGGTQKSIVRCVKELSGSPVVDRRCEHLEKPPSTALIRCNLKPCPAKWNVGPWSSCSSDCGEGEMKRSVHCEQKVSSTLTMRVGESACNELMPPTTQKCQLGPCFKWETTPWTPCSASCGNGVRSRTVTCTSSPTNEKTADLNCNEELKPVSIIGCNMGPCSSPSSSWLVSEWTRECSESGCGTGLQTRVGICTNIGVIRGRNGTEREEDNLVEEEEEERYGGDNNNNECDERQRPVEERECFTDRECGVGTWFTSSWTSCSTSCGAGLKTRQVLCLHYSRGKFRPVDESHCLGRNKPEVKMSCENSVPCPPRWFTTEWTECSVSCGGGVERRFASCRSSNITLTSSSCFDSERPIERRSCNEHSCQPNPNNTPNNLINQPSNLNNQNNNLNNNYYGNVGKLSGRDRLGPKYLIDSIESTDTDSAPVLLTPSISSNAKNSGKNNLNTISTTTGSPQSNSSLIEPNEEPDSTSCTDQYRNCALVVQARLCRYKYYRSVCCTSCTHE